MSAPTRISAGPVENTGMLAATGHDHAQPLQNARSAGSAAAHGMLDRPYTSSCTLKRTTSLRSRCSSAACRAELRACRTENGCKKEAQEVVEADDNGSHASAATRLNACGRLDVGGAGRGAHHGPHHNRESVSAVCPNATGEGFVIVEKACSTNEAKFYDGRQCDRALPLPCACKCLIVQQPEQWPDSAVQQQGWHVAALVAELHDARWPQ